MVDGNLDGWIVVLTLYDIADEIRLSALQPLVGATPAATTFKHPAPEYVRFERPPVIERLGLVGLGSGEQFDATIQYYDYGVASLLLRFAFAGSWQELEQLSASWISSPVFDEFSRQRCGNGWIRYKAHWSNLMSHG
jgi:hypothetical protein